MNDQNPVLTTRTRRPPMNYEAIDAYVREATRLREEALGALLASAWKRARRLFAAALAILDGRVAAANDARRPSSAPHR